MIPQQYITEWSEIAPRKANEQVEQGLIIFRTHPSQLSYLKNLEDKMKDQDFVLLMKMAL